MKKMMNEILNKFCPTTILLNVGAIGISLTDLEIGLKILSYLVAIIYSENVTVWLEFEVAVIVSTTSEPTVALEYVTPLV